MLANRKRAGASRRGAATVIFLVLLLLIVILGAFSVDYAYVKLSKTELRIAVDASTRAAAANYGESQDLEIAKAAAEDMAALYTVAGQEFSITEEEFQAGSVEKQADGTYAFIEGATPYNAFRIESGFVDESERGPVDSIFASVHEVETFQILSQSTVAEIDLDIVLVLDRSGSMAWDLSGVAWQYPDGNSWYTNYYEPPDAGSRWAALESAINVFADVLEQKAKQEHVAITSYSTDYESYSKHYGEWFYSNEADLNLDLVPDYDLLRQAVEEIGDEAIIGGTNISAGMDLGLQVLLDSPRAASAYKVMIVLTDGQWNAGRNPTESAEDAAEEGVKIFSVTFSDGADIDTMQQVANIGNGTMYHAATQEELEDAFRQIANSLEIVFIE